ncbi:MAG: hypothetical protein KJ676_05295 [Alphaproteobacteria bacterium]|nr:hypothetical protein [Alphaproteobacteria bacterium]MBU1525161.1 hypothetical protein [Alphaproteobacteria bacterium]MBU2117485.1 hypothetical protein [Alphaproteobacteria bacterium]MBU2352157.1 hypothetical protein [Alphaproteobacteria bacterium]MBU2381167.1 hypothetical protein [Alphaproteobacteria bacterium]
MKSGIHALVHLREAPLDVRDTRVLFGETDDRIAHQSGFRAELHDPDSFLTARCGVRGIETCFVGHLDEPDEARRALGLAAGAGAAETAAAAHDAWGVAAARRLPGEWTMLRWSARSRTLVLLASERTRDPCFFSVVGDRVAVSSDLRRLADLPWVGDQFDPDGLMRTLGRYPLRATLGDRTFLKTARRLRPGVEVTITAAGTSTQTLPPPPQALLTDLSFDEAMAEVEALLRRIVKRRMAGHRDVAFMLSGGLDSSLLAWLGAEERAAGQRIHLLCSAAPEGSGLADETGWAGQVADHLGLPLIRVAPAASAEVYTPGTRTLQHLQSPILSPRHDLYEAFADTAEEIGAATLVDGSFGEMTLSSHAFFLDRPPSWPRLWARAIRRGLQAAQAPRRDALAAFHARPSPELLAALGDTGPVGDAPVRRLRPDEAFGLEEGWEKMFAASTVSSSTAVRYAYPFRDPRLVRLVSAFPAGFTVQDGAPRAMIRALLKGNLPEAIATRQCKMPFSPSHAARLREQAPAARARLPAQREAGADAWLDLAWLEEQLSAVEHGAPLTTADLTAMQATAFAAEFFSCWATPSRRPG